MDNSKLTNNKKIAILTYHTAVNYGAVLQAYALSTYLASNGFKCKIVDYQCAAIDQQYDFMSWKNSVSLASFVGRNLTYLFRKRKKKAFAEFRKKLSLTKSCNIQTIKDFSEMFDVWITGSDQVFNPKCTNSDSTYFLDFVKEGTKNSYSASMGSITHFKSAKFDALDMLKSFKNLSLREPDAAYFLQKKLNKECFVTVDPVWLLSASEWEKVAVKVEEKSYILVYNLMNYKYMRKFAQRLKQITKLPIISINSAASGDILYSYLGKCRSNCSPAEFLGLIKNAEYVVTDSFHATSFSIIFRKKFFSAMDPRVDNTNSRLEYILKITKLESRYIDENTINICTDNIDYSATDNKLADIIKFSKEYLNNICLQT